MKNKAKFIFLVLLGAGVLFSGCAGPKGSQEVKDVPSTAVGSLVQIVWDRPAVPFMILGRVKASAPTETPDEALYLALQKEGEKLYAQAIVVQQGGIQAVRVDHEIKKEVNGWAISYTSHDPVHRDPTSTKSEEELDEQERNIPAGFGLLQ